MRCSPRWRWMLMLLLLARTALSAPQRSVAAWLEEAERLGSLIESGAPVDGALRERAAALPWYLRATSVGGGPIGRSSPDRGGMDHDSADRALAAAQEAYARGDFTEAVRRYEALAIDGPRGEAVLAQLSWARLQAGDEAGGVGGSVAVASPYFAAAGHEEGRLLEALVLLRRCRFDQARRLVAPLLEVAEPDELDAAHQLCVSSPARSSVCRQVVRTWGDRRDARAARALRAWAIEHDAVEGERRQREAGLMTRRPTPQSVTRRDEGPIAWSFEGRFWRDELVRLRRTVGDACPPESSP